MKAIIEYLTQRTTSKFLISFIAFFIILHWGVITTALFVDQDLIYQRENGMLKNEYLTSQLLFGNAWLDVILGLAASFLLAFVYVRLVPIFYNWIYKYEVNFDATRKLIKRRADQKILDADAKAAKTRAAASEAEAKDAENRSRTAKATPELTWTKEYDGFMKLSNSHQTLEELSNSVYGHNGSISGSYGIAYISTENLATGDLYGLCQYRSDNHSRIELTEKGKFFLRTYRSNKG